MVSSPTSDPTASIKQELSQSFIQNGNGNGFLDSMGGMPPAKRIRHESSNNEWGDSESSTGGQYSSQGYMFTSPSGSVDDPFSPTEGKF